VLQGALVLIGYEQHKVVVADGMICLYFLFRKTCKIFSFFLLNTSTSSVLEVVR